MRSMMRGLAVLALLGWALLAMSPASAQPVAEAFPLGQGGRSGAVCDAVRNYDDALAQAPGVKAWTVRCRGWDVPLGHLYRLSHGQDAWIADLQTRAKCREPREQSMAGLSRLRRSACALAKSGSEYVTYVGARRSGTVVAEGFPSIADVLESGLRVVAGVARPPKATDRQVSAAQAEIAADFGGSVESLARANAAAAADPQAMFRRGYVQNNEWQFTQAETDFRALVLATDAQNAPATDQALALMNLALNVSNNRRFAEADAYFARARLPIAGANDPLLEARGLNYQALHLRNQRKFAEAIATAQRALEVREASRKAASTEASIVSSDAVFIDADAARTLNSGGSGLATLTAAPPSPADVMAVQDAQALQTIGTSQWALGDKAAAQEALERAVSLVSARQSMSASAVVLRARLEADLAALDRDRGDLGRAQERLQGALALLRTRHTGTTTEGELLLELGGTLAARGDRPGAIAAFESGLAMFRDNRGALGASVDRVQAYLDLLLDEARRDPGSARLQAQRFLAAADTAVSDETTRTIALLAQRVAQADDQTAGLARALEDSRRRARAAESKIAELQASGAYTGEAKALADADLAQSQALFEVVQTELAQVSPGYAQLVSTHVTLEELQSALQPGEVYLKLLPLGTRTYGMLITTRDAVPYGIDANRAQVDSAVHMLRAPFDTPGKIRSYNVAAAHTLFDILTGPVRDQVLAARHLIYEPSGSLVSLPISALVVDDASGPMVEARRVNGDARSYVGVKWFGAQAPSSLVVSPASFLQSRRFKPSAANRAFMGFGDPLMPRRDPAFASLVDSGTRHSEALEQACGATRSALLGLKALPETARELRAVGDAFGASSADLITQAAFNDSSVKARSDLKHYRVLYFATHAILPQPAACLPLPSLVTSLGGGDSDALLDAAEILQLRLDADLVVLAACDTADSEQDPTGLQGGGEALGGLARAMIYAGARGLVVSHWAVDSDAAARLMIDMFNAKSAGQAQGLLKAQQNLMRNPATSHPYYWAPFTVVGDGARSVIPETFTEPLLPVGK